MGAEAKFIVQKVRLPDEYESGDAIGVSAWVGISKEYNGDPQLLQAGWAALYKHESSKFRYFIWCELYPLPPILLGDVEPHDEIHVSVYVSDKSKGRSRVHILIPTKNKIRIIKVRLGEEGRNIRYAHFIVEAPYVSGKFARLPRFNTISINDVTVVLVQWLHLLCSKGQPTDKLGILYKIHTKAGKVRECKGLLQCCFRIGDSRVYHK